MALAQGETTRLLARTDLRAAIAALASGASIETSTRNLTEIDDYPGFLPAGADVFIAWVPGTPYHHIASVAKRLRLRGFNPVPHVAARQIASREAAADLFARLRDEAGVERALAIAGDLAHPLGPFDSSLALLKTGILQAHGIRSVGVAGYPEGHPRLKDLALWEALEAKVDFAGRADLALFIVTQFCFDGATILGWLHRLRDRGIALPVRVGLAGPANVRTLLGYARLCGIGNSIRALTARGISLPLLIAQQGPDSVVQALAAGGATGLGVVGLHLFPFGGFARSAKWLSAAASGRVAIDPEGSGFAAEP